ncbi:selenoprotein W [Coprinopsis cinerea okayama7|uniref:Selenoprotein W n=1 Tax=Coprinopsis cinerea (strain Okayama-7 / 130 / ATCC MYA-4618 / FGSC 9003) TaxID=240176 RepID=A8NWR8_COPC7|nr:selenoprotein W [Coprinopsis cinerea okayama7\|eukprot:XP_001836969.1 selenoprotein W [Coprinopsis cinerea okayama7\
MQTTRKQYSTLSAFPVKAIKSVNIGFNVLSQHIVYQHLVAMASSAACPIDDTPITNEKNTTDNPLDPTTFRFPEPLACPTITIEFCDRATPRYMGSDGALPNVPSSQDRVH